MQDYTTAANDVISAIRDISSGSYGAVTALLTSSTSAGQRGDSAIARVSATINALRS